MLHEIVPLPDVKECPTDELRQRLKNIQVAAGGDPKPDLDCHECGEPLTQMELAAEHLVEKHICSRCFKLRHAH